jgi:large subunit ribosomal protein L17
MIHRNKGRKLGRTAPHRKATLSNLSVSLIQNKKIRTTLAKAKELRRFVEPLLTKSKKAFAAKADKPSYGLHLRREANRFLRDKTAITTLFEEIAPKIAERNGGYTRVLKLGRRLGDAAEMAIIELVDYNTGQQPAQTETETTEKKKSGTKPAATKPKAKKQKKAAASDEKVTETKKKKTRKKETAK